MKINLEIDCTPEEARRTMGLPDLTVLHDKYLSVMSEAMDGQIRPELIETMMKGWAPMGEASMAMWRRLFEAGGRSS